MWDLDLSDVDAAVVQRIKIRADRSNLYFPNDTFQAMPTNGYTTLFSKILDHARIEVSLSTEFDKKMLDHFDFCFNSMPIDEYFGFKFGRLPYRSIRFHLTQHCIEEAEPHTTVNYTDDGPFTRETWWHNIPDHWDGKSAQVLRSVEEPCDYRDNDDERYYPVKSSDGSYDRLYEKYREEAIGLAKMNFIGRCGTYQYLDMHQVINQSLSHCQKWISENSNS